MLAPHQALLKGTHQSMQQLAYLLGELSKLLRLLHREEPESTCQLELRFKLCLRPERYRYMISIRLP